MAKREGKRVAEKLSDTMHQMKKGIGTPSSMAKRAEKMMEEHMKSRKPIKK